MNHNWKTIFLSLALIVPGLIFLGLKKIVRGIAFCFERLDDWFESMDQKGACLIDKMRRRLLRKNK